MEIWKPIKNYEDYYEVSNMGNIRNKKTLKKLKAHPNENGYMKVQLCVNYKIKRLYVHHLVAISFLDKKVGLHINHIDRDKKNNSVNNLEIITPRENNSHKRKDKFTGVYYRKDTKKYRSIIFYNGKNISLGHFNTELDAYNAYLKKLKELNLTNKYASKF